jgi:hypothetical protein
MQGTIRLETVKLLVERGADVEKARTDDGSTPLFIASQVSISFLALKKEFKC